MVKRIEFGQGVLDFVVPGDILLSATKGNRRLQLYFCHCGAVPMIHSREIVELFQADDSIRAREVRERVFELLGTHTRIGRIDLDLLDGCRELLELDGCSDVSIELLSRAIER